MRMSNHLQKTPPIASETLYNESIILEAPGKAKLESIPLTEPGEEEVRVKIEGSGVCASSIPVWEGREWFNYPLEAGAPGHEGWGIVDAVGENVKNLFPMQRVTGLMFHTHATHEIIHPDMLVRLPDFLDGKPFPGEPLGCVMNIFTRSQIKQGDTVAIVGCGFIGLLLIQLAKSLGTKVIAISRRNYSLKMAKKNGADHLIAMDDHYCVIEKVKKITKDAFCNNVIECTGEEWPLNLSVQLTGDKGKLVVAGFHQDGLRQVDMQTLNWRGIDMINAHERNPKEYIKGIKKAITAIQIGDMDPFPLFTHTYSLDQTEIAYKSLTQRPEGFIKALILNS